MAGGAGVTNINEVLDGHVSLDVRCVDRLYLNAYVPSLQVGGQVVRFITGHLGKPIPSAAPLGAIGTRFRRDVKAFAAEHGIPILQLNKPDRSRWDDRKLDHVRPYLERAERERRFGVVAIVACQEFQWVISARNRATKPKAVCFEFFGEERRVGVYCFYICDPDFGPGFIKICTYFPYPAKVWINGHEWAKRQAEVAGIDHTALSNGFASCPQPGRLQAICDGFGAQHVQWFFDRWSELIPTPFTDADRAAGYWWELSMRQVEVSRTLVFDDPRHARAFFEALVADTIAIGRPEQIALVFARQLRKTTKGPFRTRVFNPGTDIKIDFSYRHSRVKQYLKDGRALRIEAVINKPSDLGVLARLEHLPELIDKARAVTPSTTGCLSSSRPVRAVPSALRCLSASTSPTTERAIEPERCASGIHAPWPWPAPCTSCCTPSPASPTRAFAGTSPDSSAQPYSQSKMSYDLRRLRLHGLIARLPHSNTYVLTAEGVRVAVFYSKLHNRLLRPLLDADKPPAPIPVRRALATLEHAVNDYVHSARLAA